MEHIRLKRQSRYVYAVTEQMFGSFAAELPAERVAWIRRTLEELDRLQLYLADVERTAKTEASQAEHITSL